MAFELDDDYKSVAERIADFREKHPDGRLRPLIEDKPFSITTIGDKIFVVYVAAAYRDANDGLPGVGVAWEPFPGGTPYTKNSELQNAETAAWGRAIIAALASEAKHVASREEAQRQAPAIDHAQKEAMDGLVEVISLVPDDHKDSLKAHLKTMFGDWKAMDLDSIHKATTIAAGWPPPDETPGVNPEPEYPRDDAGNIQYPAGHEPF